ncbi:MAG: septum formation initiator family protein [Dehalococcoidia bacterium]|nr:septum formation initiator family protein [Dehalococcoidia bacterium]
MKFFLKTRARLFFFACLIVAGYFTYTAIAGAVRNHQLAEQRQEAELRVAALEQKKAYIEAVRDYVSSDQYVEQEARRQLGYVFEGEVPFVVVSPPLEQDAQPRGEWWERLFPR